MSVYVINRSTTVNQVDQLGTAGAPLAAATGLVPPGTPETALTGSASWTPGAVTAGSAATTTATVAGSRVGDTVAISVSPPLASGLSAFGAVSAAGTVTVTLQNHTAASVTPGALTVTVSVLPQNQVAREDGSSR